MSGVSPTKNHPRKSAAPNDMALHNRERRLLRVEVELLSARIVCAETQRRAA